VSAKLCSKAEIGRGVRYFTDWRFLKHRYSLIMA
jgi:hypothetical protein